ncbi:MAG: hypothetical protein WA532_08510, partial [Candidatus Korobacteraceae bacterium]
SLPHVAERQTVPNSAILVHLAGFQIAFSHIRPAGRIYMRRPCGKYSFLTGRFRPYGIGQAGYVHQDSNGA